MFDNWFYLLTITEKGSSLDVWDGLHPLATFAKSSTLDFWHEFNPLTISANGSS